MLTSSHPYFLCVALIYSLFLLSHIGSLHSAQQVIEREHFLAGWDYKRQQLSRNKALMREYRKIFFGFLGWLVACFAGECLFGHHFSWTQMEYDVLFYGSIAGGVAGIAWYARRYRDISDHRAVGSVGAMLTICGFYGLSWIAGAAALLVIAGGWYFIPTNES